MFGNTVPMPGRFRGLVRSILFGLSILNFVSRLSGRFILSRDHLALLRDRRGKKTARVVVAASVERQTFLPAGVVFDQTREQRKVEREIFEKMGEIALQRARFAGRRFFVRRPGIAPGGELFGDRFLNCFTKRQVGCAARPGANEVALVEDQARRQAPALR